MKQTNSISNVSWNDTTGYELYVGRWSRIISSDFIRWLNPPAGLTWLEIGCGTGALTSAILAHAAPSHITAIDKSRAYLSRAQADVSSKQVTFLESDVQSLSNDENFDIVTSGLVLNFLPDPVRSVLQLADKCKFGGCLSAFVWDYGGHYQPMRHFWEAAKAISPIARNYDAGIKYEICNKEQLIKSFQSAGLVDIEFTNLERVALFRNFEDYWLPIASAQGSVTEFMSLIDDEERTRLKELLRTRLPMAMNGEVKLIINALGIKGRRLGK